MEYFVHLRLQGHPDHRLRHPVNDIGNTENPYASLLRYFHRADRSRENTTPTTCDVGSGAGAVALSGVRSRSHFSPGFPWQAASLR